MISSLVADRLTCVRGDRALFEGLSFRVGAGEALSVEGANGAGKTSLLRLIAGFLEPRSGSLTMTMANRDVAEPEERGRLVGWFGHQDGLKPQLTVAEQLLFFARLYRSDAAVAARLAEVGLARQADLACRYLSAGQKRRLALARLLIAARPLWLLDEPFAALDADGRDLIGALMARHCAGGGIIVAATHEPLGLGNAGIRL